MRIYLLSSLFQGARLHFAGIITLTILLIAKYSSMYNVNDMYMWIHTDRLTYIERVMWNKSVEGVGITLTRVTDCRCSSDAV